MLQLAASSGTVIYESGNKLYLIKKPSSWISTFLFVTGLLAIILLGNGVLQLTVFKDQFRGPANLAWAFIGIAVVLVLIFWRVRLYQKKLNAVSPEQLQTICIFDFGSNTLLNNQQKVITPLNEVWLSRKMQLTSSSPELILQWNGGSLCIIKGNPFSGGIADIEKVLLAKGIRKK